MSIQPNSRYQPSNGGYVFRAPNGQGAYNTTVFRTVPSNANQQFTQYVWQGGDRPDTVAHFKLGNSLYWWAIFDANPELLDPLNIPAGTVIRIPYQPIQGQGTTLQ